MHNEKDPNDTSNTTVIAVIKSNKVLILKRSASDYWMPLCWGFAGGHVMIGETAYQAARRELKEEAGLRANNLVLLKTQKLNNGGVLSLYKCDDFDGDVTLNFEHSEFQWVDYDKIDELKTTPDLKEFARLALEIPFGY